jgi:hypothetical protein
VIFDLDKNDPQICRDLFLFLLESFIHDAWVYLDTVLEFHVWSNVKLVYKWIHGIDNEHD